MLFNHVTTFKRVVTKCIVTLKSAFPLSRALYFFIKTVVYTGSVSMDYGNESVSQAPPPPPASSDIVYGMVM